MAFDTLIQGHVILADREITQGYIAISNGKVAEVGEVDKGLPSAKDVYQFDEGFILPAAIDAQTHSRSQAGVEDFIWSTRSAAAGGVGTIVDMPYDAGQLICNAQRFEQKKSEAMAQARVDFALYATCHPEEGASKIAEQIDAGAIGFKFSTFGTDPTRFPRIPPQMMHACFTEIAKYGLFAGVHNEDDEVVKSSIAKLKSQGRTDWRSHGESRPIYAENLAINQVYELGVDTGCRAHVVHCSNGRGHQICETYKAQGYDTTIETCLHYLTLCEEEDVQKLLGKAKVNPPIRNKEEREKIWQYIAKGAVDAVSTDHVSWSIDRKHHQNMFDNASGAVGLELLVPLVIDGAVRRGIPLTRVVQALTYKPARLFSIEDTKGALEVGKDADLTLIKKSPYIYQASASGHNFSDWSPYDGREIDYQVMSTMVRGEWVFDGKEVLSSPGQGQFIRPLRSKLEKGGTNEGK